MLQPPGQVEPEELLVDVEVLLLVDVEVLLLVDVEVLLLVDVEVLLLVDVEVLLLVDVEVLLDEVALASQVPLPLHVPSTPPSTHGNPGLLDP